MRVLGLIPARRNSRRLPGKNTLPFMGKPLIAWTIEAARGSRLLTHLTCSTDDPEVMRICDELLVSVIIRPPELATDTARSEDVALHVVRGFPCDYLCLLQPTSPLRSAQDIDRCIEACRGQDSAYIASGRNDRNDVMQPTGGVYVTRVAWLLATGMLCPRHVVVPVSTERAVDIDTAADFERAESYARAAWMPNEANALDG